MRVLVACECSGVVRRAFRALGHDAWSCDLLPASDGGEHFQEDALEAADSVQWDLLIAHPPCDYLATCAAWAFKDPDFKRFPGVGYHQKVKSGTLTGRKRRIAREKAQAFFFALWGLRIPRICIENPIGCMNTHIMLPNKLPGRQIIQPHWFGDDASKATCLWLRGLSPLVPTKHVLPRAVCQNAECGAVEMGAVELVEKALKSGCIECGAKSLPRWANQTDSGQNRLSPSETRAADRAVTYPDIAQAMAEQWGNL